MALKKDGTGRRWIEVEILAPGTPEQVWQAVATGPGNTAWFTKTTIEERVGGALRFDFGPQGTSSGEVTAWEPPHRLGYVERDWSPGAPPVATELTVETRSGGTCIVRMVHSLFSSTDDWDDQLEGFESGWPAFFEVLRLYLAHHAGMPGASFVVMERVEGDHVEVWKRFSAALGIAGADAGERRTTPVHPQALSGEICRVEQDAKQRIVFMRFGDQRTAVPGVAMFSTDAAGATINASVALYFYGADAATLAASSELAWGNWLRETFAAVNR
jgi:uncharacterized protein YndB with AHSA1/START domain